MKISPVQKAPTKQDNVVNKILEKKPRFQYDPISEELQDVNAPGWAEKATKQMDDIKKSSRKVSVQRTETKSPELSGVDRYILAKKI
jgi:spore coat protein CotF